MAKYTATATPKAKKEEYPSNYGSHISMVDDKFLDFNLTNPLKVILKDDRGSYVTDRKILDTKICDFNRTANTSLRESRLKIELEG